MIFRRSSKHWCRVLSLALVFFSLAFVFLAPSKDGKCDCFPFQPVKSRSSSRKTYLSSFARNDCIPNSDAKTPGGGGDDKNDVSNGIIGGVQRERFLVHKGRSVDILLAAPAITGLTVYRNWSSAATDALKAAVKAVATNNPILSGVVQSANRHLFSAGEIWIETGWYQPLEHDFLRVIPTPANITAHGISSLSSNDLLSYVEDYIEPHFDHLSSSTAEQIEKRSPLFEVSIMPIPSDDYQEADFAIFCLTLSHAVGDGVTFFQVLKEISKFMNENHGLTGSSVSSIDWRFRSQAPHELFPTTFSQRDVDVAYGLPFFVGLVKNAILTFHKRKPSILLLDKDKVKIKKLKMRRLLNSSTVSSNDVVSLALCQSNADVDIFVFTENARDEVSIPRNAGGNFYWEIPVSSEDVISDPLQFRNYVTRRKFYPRGQLPLQPFLCGRVGRLTSLATVSEQLRYDGVETLCSLPVTSFLRAIPMDVALIFSYNKRYLGVLHNFVNLQPGVLDALIAKEKCSIANSEC